MKRPSTHASVVFVAALAMLSVAGGVRAEDKRINPGTFDLSFSSLGTRTCGAALSSTATLKNSGTVAEKGSLVLNGGPSLAYDVAPGASAFLPANGQTLDCTKGLNLVGTAKTSNPVTGSNLTRTLAADAVEYWDAAVSLPGGGKLYVTPTGTGAGGAKCGAQLAVTVTLKDAPAGANASVTLASGAQSTRLAVVDGHAQTWVVTSSLDCAAAPPVVTYRIGSAPQKTLSPSKVTFK